ncbi:hypothetical protein [Virgisporangium ochraceum]|uniref:Uncharacterized protein n=1 Tax=Virgisporangium ochraceum TaxID=65505 RepID=A0A8J3ZYE5_9ACTN|nr:hypothetical protein [Virgisporangium ochraceum]GIJ70523.1 hypothetical protein Voc01_054400 [Virgisporangium ochraceum]
MPEDDWAPVVYGRLLHVDDWWRADPSGRDPWVRRVVQAAVSSGWELDRSPRLLLAHSGDRCLVGVACLCRDLGTELDSDGRRPFYCFVGWLGTDRAAAPAFDQFRAGWTRWAAATYDAWVRPDWHRTVAGPVHTPPGGPAPWGVVPPPAGRPLPSVADAVWLHPAARTPAVWEDARSTPRPVVLLAGLRTARRTRLRHVTDACVADVASPTTMATAPEPVEPPEPEEDPPVPPPADPPRRTGRTGRRWWPLR